jgi:hypothetical protein
MIMRNLNDELANIEIAIAVAEVERNPHISLYLKLGVLSGTFYTDIESAMALRFELDNAIKKAERKQNE